MRAFFSGLIVLSAAACDGSFSTPGGHPVPPPRDTAGADTTTPPSDTRTPPPADTTPDTRPADTTPDTRPADTTPTDTRPDPGPEACTPDTFACTAAGDLEYCDAGVLRVADCGVVCRDAGWDFTTGCGFDDTYGGDVCWCDDEQAPPPPPSCTPTTCDQDCRARGLVPVGCVSGTCRCEEPAPPGPSCAPIGWSCEGETLTYCDGAAVERWDCDAFCQDEGFAYASACGWDAALGGDACKCEDDACTSGLDLCLGSDFLETCGASGPVTVDCWDVCHDAGYDRVAGCGHDAAYGGDSCFCENEVCAAGDLVCADGSCLDPRYVCDGVSDCSTGDDEWGCPATCVEGEAWCTSSWELEVCDGGEEWVYDCDAFCRDEGFDYAEGCGYDPGSGGDACLCAFTPCASWEFQCNDGLCLDLDYTCDGILDCWGGEDEAGCY